MPGVLSAGAADGAGDVFTATVWETGDLDMMGDGTAKAPEEVALAGVTIAAAAVGRLRPVRTAAAGPPTVRAAPLTVRARVSVMVGALTPLRTTAERLGAAARPDLTVVSA